VIATLVIPLVPPIWRYMSYIVRHKWYVFLWCCRYGIPILGLTHDMSKFRPSEFFPYLAHFGQRDSETRNPGDRLQHAIELHYSRNKHHWQWWLQPDGQGGTVPTPMRSQYAIEMVADWRGAGRAQGRPDTLAWYRDHKDKIDLHPATRRVVEQLLGLEDWNG